MEKQQWTSKNRQAVAMELEQTGDYLNNGISNNLHENGNKNSATDDGRESEDKLDRNSRIQQVVEAAVSDLSRKTIENILDQVKTLTPTEHLLLYLKLPTECSSTSDPLRQPLNPLGSRSEISQTIMWIKTHLEEDPELSLPKQDVYNEYYAFCGPNKIKPLSTADFGKVMKQVYPRVRPRRLGTRGNSRYCYAGLRRRLKLDSPLLPDLSDKPQSSEVSCSSADLLSAAWTIVKEWSERQLGIQFASLQALACYLVLNLSIGNGSGAAALVTSATKSPFKQGDSLQSNIACINKHREAQLQLQRKIQQKNEISREQKRKIQLQSPKVEHKTRGNKRCKTQNQATVNPSPTATTSDINASPPQGLQPVCDKSIDFANLQALPDFSSFQKTTATATTTPSTMDQPNEYTKQNNNNNNSCENNTNNFVPKTGKVPIPRLNSSSSKFSPLSSPKRAKNAKYKAIQPKPESCDIGAYNPQQQQQQQQQSQLPMNVATAVDFRSQDATYINTTTTTATITTTNKCENKKTKNTKPSNNNNTAATAKTLCKSEIETTLTSLEDVSLPRERLISISDIDKSALDDYLGTSNSQEHEEELIKYFENKEKTSSEQDMSSKLCQLRQLLITQQNLNLDCNNTTPAAATGMTVIAATAATPAAAIATEPECPAEETLQENNLNLSSLLSSTTSAFSKANHKNALNVSNLNMPSSHYYPKTNNNDVTSNYSARRRVSFEMLQQEDGAVPASPNTRRKNFNFTPISPGPLSPGGGRQSKCSSTTASPFVSPRITPVPRTKGNLHQQQNVSTSYIINQTNSSSGYSARKLAVSNKPTLKIKQETDLHNEMMESGNDIQNQLLVSTDVGGYLPMSAPASPKLPFKSTTKNSNLLQKLLNSNNKVLYTPNYSRSQSLTTTCTVNNDPLSTEICQLFSNNIQQLNLETGYRSQSVPLHQMAAFKSNQQNLLHSPLVQNTFGAASNQFLFTTGTGSVPQMPVQNEFVDYDSFSSASENINMNKILSTLDTCPNTVVQNSGENDILSGCNEIENVFNNMPANADDISLNNLSSLGQENFETDLQSTPTNVMPNLRGLGRSQSIDVDVHGDINLGTKYNPSRSVPGTPIPYGNTKSNVTKNYRSYPSTPLTINESFCYNHGQDYLLNGQPIKEKVAETESMDVVNPTSLQFFQNSESNDEEIYQNMNMFNVNDTGLNCDILIEDNKNNYNFEGQFPTTDNNYSSKTNMEPVLDENCVMNGHNYDFKNTINGNDHS